MQTSKGLLLAWIMLVLMAAELLALSEVVFFDSKEMGEPSFGLQLYFYVVLVTVLLQITGIILVKRGSFRVGGILQIIASAPHAIKLEGLIGIMGGLDAYDYPEELAQETTGAKNGEKLV